MSLPTKTPSVVRKATTRTTKSIYSTQEKRRHLKKQSRVRFDNTVTVTEVPSHRVYNYDERFAVWYTQSEYRVFSLQESLRKLKTKTNNKSELSDHIQKHLHKVRNIQVSVQPRRKYNSKNLIGAKHKSAKLANKLHDAFSKVLEARKSTDRKIAEIQRQLQGHQRLPTYVPGLTLSSSAATEQLSMSSMQTKHDTMVPQIPFPFSNGEVPIQPSNTPMTDPNSPVARGA
jgi:hypothetical protein